MRAPLRGGKSKEWGRPPEAPLQPCAGLTAALTAMGVPRPRTKPLRGIGALFRRCAIPEKSVHFDIWRTCVTVELIDLHTEFPMAMEKLSPLHRPKLEIADIFRAQGHAWRLANAGHVSLSQPKVMSAIEVCRTEALGGHVAGCIECGHHHIAYNSCKNRHCPKCQGPAARDWMEARAEDLLPVEYFHVVFTLPAEIAQIVYWNKKAVYGLLFKASAETVKTIAADPKRLGVNVGLTSVLHSWGSAMTHHPHIHMIVPGGGLSPDGNRWVSCKPGFFLPVRVLSRLFRRLFLDGLMALHRAGDLAFFGDLEHLVQAGAFAAWLAPFRKSEWVVYSKPPFGGPEAVLAYLSRYTHRVAISNHRLVSADADMVAFRWKDYRAKDGDRQKVMGLATSEFIRRFLMHVLPTDSIAFGTTAYWPAAFAK